jgi:hypothetical protein
MAAAAADAGSCTSQSPQPDAKRKFHPGHYVAIGRSELRKGFDAALRNVMDSGVVGVQLRYRWADLEPQQDRYDFAPIARDLASAKRVGLQLVALVEDKSFRDEVPTPQYLQEKYTLRSRNKGFTAVRWDAFVNQRFRKLVDELGREFDCDPSFEGVAFQETALSLDESELSAAGYTPEKYRDALVQQLRSATRSLPRSRVFWYMNFLPRKQDYIRDIANDVAGTGVVMGGPDVLPENQALARRVYPFYSEFRGRMKLFGSMQRNSFRHMRTAAAPGAAGYWSMADLFEYARDKLHVDYVFWDYRPTRAPGDTGDWGDVQAVIRSHPTF